MRCPACDEEKDEGSPCPACEGSPGAARDVEIAWLYTVARRAARLARLYRAEGPEDARAQACIMQLSRCRARVRDLRGALGEHPGLRKARPDERGGVTRRAGRA